MNVGLREILKAVPLRVAITDYCNLGCVFCSNEGMGPEQRNLSHVDTDSLLYLVGTLKEQGLDHVALTGGDPSLHPELERIMDGLEEHEIGKRFIHTNGIALRERHISGQLKGFTKVGVSVHAFDYDTWNALTKGTVRQFGQVMANLDRFAEEGYGSRVEIKHVPMEGINDSSDCMRRTLDYCAERGFKFKFLNFEPISDCHAGKGKPVTDLTARIEALGAKHLGTEGTFRGQTSYLPIQLFEYRGTKGVSIDIGCGREDVCKACYKSNEILVTPALDIKPCHASGKTIPLRDAIDACDSDEIMRRVQASRDFLYTAPGLNSAYWNQGLKGTTLTVSAKQPNRREAVLV
jgi:cyclic pyranopterin phosphate synthase